MERSKSRTDLLAAGRKKLQQFRSKRENKGGSSRGKSSKKSSKSQLPDADADADAASSASSRLSRTSSQAMDGNVEIDSSRPSVDSSNSLDPDNTRPSVDSSSVAISYDTGNETELNSDAKLAIQVQGVGQNDSELSGQVQEESVVDVGVDMTKDLPSRSSAGQVPEGGATYDHTSAPVDILSPPASVTTAMDGSVTVEREGDKREESLLLSEDIPNASLMQTREDQVTDLGPMQEADGLVMKKSSESTDAMIDGQTKLPSFQVGESDQCISGIDLKETRVEQAPHEVEKLGKSVEAFPSSVDMVSDKLSASDKGQGDDTAIDRPITRNLEGETLPGSSYAEILLHSSQEQNIKGVHSGQERGLQVELNQQSTPIGSIPVDETHELSMGAHDVNLARPLGADASSVNLLQLAEIIRGLNEEDYHFLLKSRGPVADPFASGSIQQDHDFSEAFQGLKEELFLANLMKSIFSMQLAEQLELQLESDNQRNQLIGELSQLQASHSEVNKKNQQLIEELANCQIELHNVSSKSVEIQNQFDTAKAEVEALSARVVELQISFEISQQDLLDLSTELADCRDLISRLQDEKKVTSEALDMIFSEKNKLAEEKEFYLCDSKELATELADVKSSYEGVKVENSNLIDRISLMTEERNKIQAELEHLSNEIDRLSLDLVENKDMVASLQAENSNLIGNLALSAEKIKNLDEDNQSAVLENHRLSSQIVALQEHLSIEKGERMKCEGDLEEATMHLEQLSTENIFLNSTLEEHKVKIEEIVKKHSQPLSQPWQSENQADVAREQSDGLEIATTGDSLHKEPDAVHGVTTENLLEHELYDDSFGFVSLKICLDEVEIVLVKLEKAIDALHSQSVSVGRSAEKVSSPVVSKLIQAFESKAPEDEDNVDVKQSSEAQSSTNSFIMLTEEQIGNLRKLLPKWKVDVQSAGALFKGERDGRKISDANYSDLKNQFEELKQHCSNVEASNNELADQCESAKQLLGDIQEKKCHLEEVCEALEQELIHLKAKNNELYENLGHCQSKISELRTEMFDVKQSSNEMASTIVCQLENLQKEVIERAMLVEQGWNTTITEIVELIGKLNESLGETLSSAISSDALDSLDVRHRVALSVNAATEMIFDLRKKLEDTYSEHEIICTSYKEENSKCDDLLARNQLAVSVLHKMHTDLRKLVLSHGGSFDDDEADVQSEALPDSLNYNNYQTVMNYLGDILNEKLELESVTKEMKSELMHRETELEELKMKCLGLDSVSNLIEDVAAVLNVETSNIEINKSPLSCLGSLVSHLVHKTREAESQLHMTKEGNGSKEMELAEKEKINYLDTRLENENEIRVLKGSLHQAEEALTAARSELNGKTMELEHLEQRATSLREKLSIAVAKGKGLVVQRDGLKQSLAETSIELERCLQELQLKDTRLNEVETKLKTYAEAGERVEALESELLYIRNSANALRESFLLKDSILQRIEEVLEDLDLPEQFHSRDIIEKIDWLARSVAGNTLPMIDWELKDSVGGSGDDSLIDAGHVVPDSWKNDSQLQPNSRDDAGKDDNNLQPDSGDDLGKTYDELRSKYYELAEQNEMLEQSLMERNRLVQRWEELVDRIDMPSHLRSMETMDRIEWVGRALAEANHHVDSLQLKIEKYDSYCGLLNADLEESQRRMTSFQADLKALTTEREHLTEKIEALIYECGKLSAQKMQAEHENEKLHNEITSLRDKMEEKAAVEVQMEALIYECEKLSTETRQAELENEKLLTEITSLKDKLEEKAAVEEQMEALIFEREKLSAQTRQAELESEKLHNEITSLKDKLVEKTAIEEQMKALVYEHEKLSAQTKQAELESEKLHNEITSLKDKLVENAAVEEQMEALVCEREKISAQTKQAEFENEKLHNEITSLKDKLAEKAAVEEQMEALVCEREKLSAQTKQAEFENEKLHNEITSLKDKLEEKAAVKEQMEALVYEYEKLSAQTKQAQLENEKLHNEIIGLKDKLEEKAAVKEQMEALIYDREKQMEALQDEVTSLKDKLEENATVEKQMEALVDEREKLSAQTNQAELENEKLHDEITRLKDKLEENAAVEEQMEALIYEHEKLSAQTKQAEFENEKLQSEITSLKDKLEEKAVIEEQMEALVYESEKLSVQSRQAELEKEKLLSEIASLKYKLEEKAAIEEQIFTLDGKIRKLKDLVGDAIGDALAKSETENLVSCSANIDTLEELLRKLIERHYSLSSMKPMYRVELDGDHSQKDDASFCEARNTDSRDEETDIDRYKKDLEEALSELEHVKEERDRTLEKQISLSGEVEALSRKTEELQQLLNQEEQKSASAREKLNIAVRKGKSLVQQRDSLKQTIEEMRMEIEHLKTEINNREHTLADLEQKLRQLSTFPDKLEALESESSILKNHLADAEHRFQEQEYSLKLILNKLGEIEVGGEGHISDPVKKLEWVGKLCSDLNGAVASLEQESRKSKRASELLLEELNEVQERNDAFQDELAKVAAELVELRKERDSAEAAKLEAVSRLEKLSALHEEQKKGNFSEIVSLKSSMNQIHKGFVEVRHLLANTFFMDLESFRNLEAGFESCMNGNIAANVVYSSLTKKHDGTLHWISDNKKSSVSEDSWSDCDTIDYHNDNAISGAFHLLGHQLQELLAESKSLKETIMMHSSLAQEHNKTLSALMASIQREMNSQRQSCEAARKEISQHDEELAALRGNITDLFEACINSVTVIENGKAELVGNKVNSSDLGINLKTPSFDDEISKEFIKTMTDRLLLSSKEFTSLKTEYLDSNQKEMKDTITNLQRELQEKDVQRDQICSELVKQMKDAEAAANRCSQDLQSLQIEEHNLKKHVEVIEEERKVLEQRVNELQDRQATAAELEEKIRSQTDLLAAKDQEIEALMHALDEEEIQMEELTQKIAELEKVVLQKTQEIGNLESSRGKVMKKLAVTVSKFDELHHLSASLLSEVEKLQSQLQERDAEISFLRQEVTRCTNDVLLASQMSNQRSSDEIFEFLMWVDIIVSQAGMQDIHPDMKSNTQVHECKEILHKKLMSVLSELENLRAVAESKNAMLQVERSKVEELNHKAETLEMSLHEKELRLNLLEGVEETGKGASTSSEILEAEPVMNEWTASGTYVTPQVRSLRKGNNDHVAIAVDVDPGSTGRIEDEDDDKVHGFKSLTSSKIIPRFTRPLTDLIDGLWVSCDRTLDRQPILRVGIIMYWAIMHALLAFFVV